jgi:hypothetical protein
VQRLLALRLDLAQRLNLSEHQRQQIAPLARGLQREQLALDALVKVASSLSAQKWMHFPTVEQFQAAFRGVLLANQMDKFYNWAKRNAAAIDALDITPPGSL